MTPTVLMEIGARVADAAETIGGMVSSVDIREAGDGSGRTVAIVTIIACDDEMTFRVMSPAPDGAPRWARPLERWTTEVVIDGDWVALDDAA